MDVNKLIQEELERHANINGYVNSLQESMVGGIGSSSSGFVNQQGTSDRLEKFNKFQRDMAEQEEDETVDDELDLELGGDDELDTEGGDDELELDSEGDDGLDAEGGDDELDLDMGADEEDAGSDVEKLDVTDIVTMTKETGEKADTVSKEINTQSKRIEDLLGKLDDLESQLGGMDKILSQMNNLENKFEELKPETPQEKLELRYLDSGPFTQTPHEFWDEKGEELKKQPEKHEYVLTDDDVSEYNDNDIKNSWIPDEEDEEEEEKFSVLGNKS